MDKKANDIIVLHDDRTLAAPSAAQRPAGAEHLVDKFLARSRSENGRRTMRDALVRAARVLSGRDLGVADLPHVPWERARAADLDRMCADMLENEDGFAPSTVALTLTAVRGILKTAWREGYLSAEELARAIDAQRVRFAREVSGREVKVEERGKLFAFADAAAEPRGLYLGALLAFLFGTGARASEVCGVEHGAYMPGSGVKILGKGNKERFVPFAGEDAARFERYWRAQRRRGPLFPRLSPQANLTDAPMLRQNVDRILDDVAEAANVAPFSPHDCRRTFCTTALRAGVDLATVQKWMGHASPSTTARYDMREREEGIATRARVKLT